MLEGLPLLNSPLAEANAPMVCWIAPAGVYLDRAVLAARLMPAVGLESRASCPFLQVTDSSRPEMHKEPKAGREVQTRHTDPSLIWHGRARPEAATLHSGFAFE